MALKYAYTSPNGDVAIVHAASKESLERVLGKLTDAQYEAHVLARSIPADATDVTKLPDDWTPPDDRTFRSAWKNNGGRVEVDFEKAKDIAEKHGNVSAAKTVEDLRKIVRGQ